MKLFNTCSILFLFLFLANTASAEFAPAFDLDVYKSRYLMSYPACPDIDYNYCPVEPIFCQLNLEQYVEQMFEAHNFNPDITTIRSYERDAIMVITSADSIGKRPYDVVRTDCGAHGLFHFQPPEGILQWAPWDVEDIIENAGDCAYFNQEWVEAVDHLLHLYPYGIGYQLLEWRERVSGAVSSARNAGWPRNRLSWALAITNSTGVGGFRQILREDPEETVRLYLEQRPGSHHRQRRIEALRGL